MADSVDTPVVRIIVEQELEQRDVTGVESVEDATIATEITGFDRVEQTYVLEGALVVSGFLQGNDAEEYEEENMDIMEQSQEHGEESTIPVYYRLPFTLEVPVEGQSSYLNVTARVQDWDLQVTGENRVLVQADLVIDGLTSQAGYSFRCGDQYLTGDSMDQTQAFKAWEISDSYQPVDESLDESPTQEWSKEWFEPVRAENSAVVPEASPVESIITEEQLAPEVEVSTEQVVEVEIQDELEEVEPLQTYSFEEIVELATQEDVQNKSLKVSIGGKKESVDAISLSALAGGGSVVQTPRAEEQVIDLFKQEDIPAVPVAGPSTETVEEGTTENYFADMVSVPPHGYGEDLEATINSDEIMPPSTVPARPDSGLGMLSGIYQDAPENRYTLKFRIVQFGDTISSLAERYHCDFQELMRANRLEEEQELPVGGVLFIPR